MQVNTLGYQMVSPVNLEVQKKGRTAERDERLTDGEENDESVLYM
jgi:hypothetical protein